MSFFNSLVTKEGGATASVFVSTTGSGSGSGAQSDPLTINQLLALNYNQNTAIYFNRGETFDIGDFLINRNNVKILGYGNGANPILRGSVSISSNTWTNEGSGIYSTVLSQTPKWLYVNGIAQKLAETSTFNITGGSGTNIINFNSGTFSAYTSSLVGAKLWSKQYEFWPNFERTITAATASSITLDQSVQINYTSRLVNQRQFIVNNGDWAYNSTTNTLYYKSAASPAGTDIRISVKDFGLNITPGVSRPVVSGITFKHYFNAAVNTFDNNHLSITNCTIQDCRTDAIVLKGRSTGIYVADNIINRIGGMAIRAGSIKNYYIGRNEITNIGTDSSIGLPIDPDYMRITGCAILALSEPYANNLTMSPPTGSRFDPENGVIEYNNIQEIGYCGVFVNGQNQKIYRNKIYRYCREWKDGGGVYLTYNEATSNGGTGNACQFNTIEQNIITNTADITGNALGIYLDNGCNDNTVINNLICGNSYAGYMTNWDVKGNVFTGNLLVGNQRGVRFSNWIYPQGGQVWGANVGNVMTGNTFICTSASQHCFEAYSFTNETGYNPFVSGGSSNNNLFIQPYSNIVSLYNGTIPLTLANHQGRFTVDSNSTARVNLSGYSGASNEIVLRKNETKFLITETSPTGTYTDPTGTVTTTKNINPFQGFVFMKQ